MLKFGTSAQEIEYAQIIGYTYGHKVNKYIKQRNERERERKGEEWAKGKREKLKEKRKNRIEKENKNHLLNR